MDPSGGESWALIVAAIAALGSLIVALIIFGNGRVGLGGNLSIGSVASQLAAVAGLPTFAWTYVHFSRQDVTWRNRGRFRRILGTIGLSVTGAAMAALLIGSLFSLFQLAFRALVLDAIIAALLVTVTVGFSTYVLFLVAAKVTTARLIGLLALFFIAGMFASMLTADDPRWWESNFSALGMGGETSARTFNLTVILAGLVIGTLADYLTIDLRSRKTETGSDLRGVAVVRGFLVGVGLALIGIGIVPVDQSLIFHNIFAVSLLGGFGTLIVLVPIVLDGLPRSFTPITAVILLLIVGAVALFWPIGYYNLTAAELVAMLLIFAWLILFVRSTSAGTGGVADPLASDSSAEPPETVSSPPAVPKARWLAAFGLAGFVAGVIIRSVWARTSASRASGRGRLDRR